MKRLFIFTSLIAGAVLSAGDQVEAAARSVLITFHNQSKLTLEMAGGRLAHGEWTHRPPKTIGPNQKVTWASESNGFMTGTEGTVTYRIKGGGQVYLWWDNPYAGGNSYDASVPAGYQLPNHGGSGDNARVDWVFRPFVIPVLPSQPINSLEVRIVTSGEKLAGNKSYKYFDIGPLGWKLMPESHPQGSDHTHKLDLHGLHLTTDDIRWLRLQKKGMGGVTGSPDGPNGAWKPASIHLKVNGNDFVQFEVNEWLCQRRPIWQVDLRPRAPVQEHFGRALRMIPNNRLGEKDKLSALLTTPLAKENGISGWKHTSIPVTFATGKVAYVAESTDGLATIDIAVENVRVGNKDFALDAKHGINQQRYLRVEYKYLVHQDVAHRLGKSNPVPAKGQRVRIGGVIFWDTDDEWWYEIHPRGPQDVQSLASTEPTTARAAKK
jgi:hypothetical protein